MKRGFVFVVLLILFLLNGVFLVSASGFDVSSSLIKVSVSKSEMIEKQISIFGENEDVVTFNIIGIDAGVYVKQDRILLNSKDSKSFDLVFDSSKIQEGLYVGSLEIIGLKKSEKIPIIFEVESDQVIFDSNLEIPPLYSRVSSGDRVLAQIKVFDLISGGTRIGAGVKSVNLEYGIMGFDGTKISSESESLVVDGSIQISKNVLVGDSVPNGDYVYYSIVNEGNSIGISSSIFEVSESSNKSFFSESFYFIFGIFFGVLLLFGLIFWFFNYFLKERDKLIIELRKNNLADLERQKKLLFEQQRVLERKGENKKKISEEIKKKIKNLKSKHLANEKKLIVLKKKGDENKMKNMVSEWKKRGYNVGNLDYKLKGLSNAEMSKILKSWKKEYKS